MKINGIVGLRDVLGRAVVVLVILVLTIPVVQGAVETKNLLKNGDFEEGGTPPPDWTIETSAGTSYEVVSKALTGKQSLKISIPVPGNVVLTSEPVPVSAGEDYLLTFWYQAEGFGADGCSSVLFFIWQDETGKQVGRDPCQLPTGAKYGSVPDYRPTTLTLRAPSNATKVQIQGTFSISEGYTGPLTTVHVDQIRLMKFSKLSIPADAKKWEYLNRQDYGDLKIVEDKDAVEEKAVLAEFGKVKQWIGLTWGDKAQEQPAGEYLATYRLKVKDNTKNEPVAMIDVYADGTLNGGITWQYILATDFKQAEVYQDFSVRFVRPGEGVLQFRVLYQGATDLWYDKKTVTQLSTFTDKEQSAIWLGQ